MAALYGLRERLGLTGLRERFGFIKHPPTSLQIAMEATVTGVTRKPAAVDDSALVERIIAAYRRSVVDFPGYGESMWSSINALAAPLHELLLSGSVEAVSDALRHPHRTNLFLGFDNPVAAPWGFVAEDRNLLSNELGSYLKPRTYMALRRLAEATGAVKISNPETETGTQLTVDEYLEALDQQLGLELPFPNPYPEEHGLVSSRGVVSFRPLQAIYQAWRLKTIGATKVMEIGAGLGRTAYYANYFGIHDYTIVDIPMSNVAQGHFLSRALGEGKVSLAREERSEVRLVGPAFIRSSDEMFDVVLNVDSLSELDLSVASGYVAFAQKAAKTFVSINREWDGAPRTADLIVGLQTLRTPYWMREGYVEEIVTL